MFLWSLSPVQYEQVYWIFLLSPCTVFPDILFVFFCKCWDANCDIWSPWYRRQIWYQFHQLNIQKTLLLCLCFICRICRVLCILTFCFWNGSFVSVGLMKLYFNQMDLKHTKSLCGHTTNSFYCLDITFIQDTNFQYSAGQHSDAYIVQVTTVYAPSPRETNTYLMFLPTQYELILIIFKSKFSMARDGQAGV